MVDEPDNLVLRLLREIRAKLDDHDRRFDGVDLHFVGIEQRFVGIDQRFVGIDQRFARMDQRFDRLERKLGEVSEAAHMGVGLAAMVNHKLDALSVRIETFEGRVATLEAAARD